ncbi:MAG: DUF2335 domain-containing protein [Pseudohongiellaceae bacterium]
MDKPPKKKSQSEIAKALESELQGKVEQRELKRTAIRLAQLIVSEQFSGPLPHPDHLQKYENTLPGAADRIFGMAERNGEHLEHMNEATLDAMAENTKRGMNYGAGLFLALIICAFGSLFLVDNPIIPAIFLGPMVIVGVMGFVRRNIG